MPQQLRFLAFQMLTPGDAGAWRDPENQRDYLSLGYWQQQAQLLEQAGFEALFFADVLGVFETRESGPELAIRDASSFPLADPFVLVSALAAVTRRLGFIVTASTSYEPPFLLARRFSTLDHLTAGRIGWNIVTSYLDTAAANFGIPSQPEPEQRYAQAREYLQVVGGLWQSWQDGALRRDAASGVYADPARVHPIDHVGRHFSVRGPHLVEPSPQRAPVYVQATMSAAGYDFAARHAEVVYTRAATLPLLARSVADIRARALAAGRATAPAVYAIVEPYLGRTRVEAEQKAERRNRFASEESALTASGIDIRAYPRDTLLGDLASYGSSRGSRPTGQSDLRISGEAGQLTIEQYLRRAREQRADLPFTLVGTPEEVTGRLLDIVARTGLDGFVLTSSSTPGTYEDFAELLTPHLRERGLLPDPASIPALLRERLLGAGATPIRTTQAERRASVTSEEKEIHIVNAP